MKEANPERVIFLHCIIHQEALCKSGLQFDHVVKPVVKLVNFIRARGLQHCWFKFLKETDTDHQSLQYQVTFMVKANVKQDIHSFSQAGGLGGRDPRILLGN